MKKKSKVPITTSRLMVMQASLNNDTYNLTLLDSGTGTDALAGDGIYSRLLSNLTTMGKHVFSVKVRHRTE